MRNAQVATIDRHLAKGEDLAAVVALRQLVQGAEGSNLLGIAPETVAELKRKLAAAEARLRSGPGATPR